MAKVEHPYDRSYLSQVVETQGRFFERLQDADEPFDSADMITAYMLGTTRAQLDAGHAYYLTLDDERLKQVFLEESGYQLKPGVPLRGFMPNWIGRFYAMAQWQSAIPSAELVKRFPVTDMVALYPGAHDLDLDLAVAKTLKS